MYDRSIQTLFGIGLRLEYCLALLDPDAEQISTALNDVMDDIAELTVDLRTRIYQLR